MRRGAAAACVLAAALPGVGGRFLGFHLDAERCTGPDSRFGNRSTLVPPCLAVLQEYAFFVGNLSGTGLTLAVDSGACAAPTCYNITWNGVSKRGHEHVRPLAPLPTPHPPPLPLPGIHASGACGAGDRHRQRDGGDGLHRYPRRRRLVPGPGRGLAAFLRRHLLPPAPGPTRARRPSTWGPGDVVAGG